MPRGATNTLRPRSAGASYMIAGLAPTVLNSAAKPVTHEKRLSAHTSKRQDFITSPSTATARRQMPLMRSRRAFRHGSDISCLLPLLRERLGALLIEDFEIDFREMHRRETGTQNDVSDVRAQV